MNVTQNDTLAQTITLLAPEAGESLLPAPQRLALIKRVRTLPPIIDGLFKFGLAANENSLALQQRVGQDSPEIAILERYLTEGVESPIPRPIATAIAKLLA